MPPHEQFAAPMDLFESGGDPFASPIGSPEPQPPATAVVPTDGFTAVLPGGLHPFATWEAAYQQLLVWAKPQGFSAEKARASDKDRQTGEYRRHEFCCSFGGRKYKSISTGLRPAYTKKTGCPWRVKIVKKKLRGELWILDMMNVTHNHPPSAPEALPRYRQLTDELGTVVQEDARLGISGRVTTARLREQHSLATRQDVYNKRRKLRNTAAGPYSDSQAVLKHLNDKFPGLVKTRLDENRRLNSIVWTTTRSLEVWKRHSSLMCMDTTNAVNRFNMPFFESVGFTATGKIFHQFFALMRSGRMEEYTWVLGAINEICLTQDFNIGAATKVALTDDDASLKPALTEVFGDQLQQQICIWHIQKNVWKHVLEKWVGPGANEPPSVSARDYVRFPPDQESRGKSRHTKDGFLAMWGKVVYSSNEATFKKAWQALGEEFSEQNNILVYIQSQWMDRRSQWAFYHTSTYRNFGHTSSQGAEAAHGLLKSYLTSSLIGLDALLDKIVQMVDTQFAEAQAEAAGQAVRRRGLWQNNPIFSNIATAVSVQALDKLQEQYNYAKSALLGKTPQTTCTRNFMAQMGMPCRHILATMLEVVDSSDGGKRDVRPVGAVNIHMIDEHWHLKRDLADVDPLFRVLDPYRAPRRPGRNNAQATRLVDEVEHEEPRSNRARDNPTTRFPSGHEIAEQRLAQQQAQQPPTATIGTGRGGMRRTVRGIGRLQFGESVMEFD